MGFPSKTDSPSCEYSRFDFDSDEDFNAFFNCKCLKIPSGTLRKASTAVIMGVTHLLGSRFLLQKHAGTTCQHCVFYAVCCVIVCTVIPTCWHGVFCAQELYSSFPPPSHVVPFKKEGCSPQQPDHLSSCLAAPFTFSRNSKPRLVCWLQDGKTFSEVIYFFMFSGSLIQEPSNEPLLDLEHECAN